MSEALEKIGQVALDSKGAEGTQYGRALAGHDAKGVGLDSNAVGGVFLASSVLSLFGFVVSIVSVAVPYNPVPWWVIPLSGGGPWTLLCPALLIRSRRLKKEIKKTLADPVLRLEWRVLKAAEIHNLRVRAFNNQLEWRELGFPTSDDATLQNLHGLLLKSEELIRSKWRIYECAKEGAEIAAATNVDRPELTDNLAGLLEAEKELLAHVAAIGPGGSSPVAKMLENESARLELETDFQGLLPAKTG